MVKKKTLLVGSIFLLVVILIGFVSTALVIGTNTGFVTVAPTGDPEVTFNIMDNQSFGVRDVSPLGTNIISEIGWYTMTNSEIADMNVAIYTDSGANKPNIVVGSIHSSTLKSTGIGWKRVTGLNIPLTASTLYWISISINDTPTQTQLATVTSGGTSYTRKIISPVLTDPWGTSTYTDSDGLVGIYAVYESVAVSTSEPHTTFKNSHLTIKDGKFQLR